MQPAAILCRSCGAPFHEDVGDHLPCRYCGTDTAIDTATRQHLVQHLARAQRAADRARCVLREQIVAQLLPSASFRMKVYLYGSVAILLLALPVVVLVGMATIMISGTADPAYSTALVILGVAILGVGGLVAVGVFPLGLFLAFREAKNLDLTAARSAREVESHLEATACVRCTQCGGHAQVVVIGQRAAVPCPWCGASLIAQSADVARMAADAIVAAQQKTTDAALLRARVKSGLTPRNRHRLQIPAFVLEGGVYVGVIHSVPVWIAFDVQPAGMQCRIEVDRLTRLAGTVWFVRRESAAVHAQTLQSYGMRQQPQVPTDPDVDARFVVFADRGVDARSVARSPVVRSVLTSLGADQSVRFDPAGASEWRLGASLLVGGQSPWSVRAEALVRAVCELG